MQSSRMLSVLMVLSLTVSGCLGDGDDEPVDETATNDTMEPASNDTMEPEPEPEEPAEEGSSDETNETAEEEPEPASAPVLTTIEVAETGTLTAGAAVWPAGTFVFLPGMDRWFAFDQAGVVTGGEVTLTWEPVLPTMETLTLLFGQIEEIEGGERMIEGYHTVTGPSPLTLSATGLDWTQGRYGVAAWYDSSQVGTVTLDQSFTITGNVTALV